VRGRLRLENVTLRFGERVALEQLSLVCVPGLATCLVGPNGAGKSTALALAAGLLPPTSGRIEIGDRTDPGRGAPQSTGYLPQESSFHPLMTVKEVLDFAVEARLASAVERNAALEVAGLGAVLPRTVRELSGGWVRRLGLASALVATPDLLLLDEPFVGLDPETLDRLLRHMVARIESGGVIVIASHDFEVIDSLGPRVVVLDEGHLRAESPPGSGPSRAVYRAALHTAEAALSDEVSTARDTTLPGRAEGGR